MKDPFETPPEGLCRGPKELHITVDHILFCHKSWKTTVVAVYSRHATPTQNVLMVRRAPWSPKLNHLQEFRMFLASRWDKTTIVIKTPGLLHMNSTLVSVEGGIGHRVHHFYFITESVGINTVCIRVLSDVFSFDLPCIVYFLSSIVRSEKMEIYVETK